MPEKENTNEELISNEESKANDIYSEGDDGTEEVETAQDANQQEEPETPLDPKELANAIIEENEKEEALENEEIDVDKIESEIEDTEDEDTPEEKERKSAKIADYRYNVEDVVPLEELPKDDLLDKFFKKSINGLKEIEKTSEFAQYYYTICNTGVNRFYEKNITETKTFEEDWIRIMESFFPSIDRILRNPKLTIRYEDEIVVIEKAKKINSASVRHLASHTEYIRDYRHGMVTPNKILTSRAEEELATYENRFIMTLINRLYYFVNQRYEVIKDNVESFQRDHMYYTSVFDLKDEQVTLKIDLDIKRDLDNKNINKHNFQLLARVEKLKTLITGYKNSQFMKNLGKAKKVNPPIMKTNVILKNPDFRNAYALWLFIDKYNKIAYDIEVRERPVRLSREFKSNIDRISALTYAGLVNNKRRRHEDFKQIEYIEPIQRKSTKLVRTLPQDVVKRPDAVMFFDNSINEYYLDLNKKVMNQRLKEYVEQKFTDDQALKKVIKDSIQITNAIFDSQFELEENEDYFSRFVGEEDPVKSYQDAKQRARVAHLLREAKEVDYKKSIKLEKSLYKQMVKATNARMTKAYKQKRDEQYEEIFAQIDKDLKAYKKDKAKNKALIEKLDEKIVDIENNKTQLDLDLDEIKAQTQEEVKAINKESRETLNQELAKLKKDHEERMIALRKEMDDELNAAKAKKEARDALNKEKLKKEKIKAKEQEKKAREAAKEKNKKALEAQKAKYKAEEQKLKAKNKEKVAKVLSNDESK